MLDFSKNNFAGDTTIYREYLSQSASLLTDLEYYTKGSRQYNDDIKTLGNIIYLFSESEVERKLASKCYKLILESDLITENNYYCLNPESDPYFYIEKLSLIDCSSVNLYFFYNLSQIMYYNGNYYEALRFLQKCKDCITSIDNFQYRDELLLKLLYLEIRIVKNIYEENPHKIKKQVDEINRQIALLRKENLKSLPEYIVINNRGDLLIIFTI